MRSSRLLLVALAVVGLAVLAWFGVTVAMIWSTLEVSQRQSIEAVLRPRLALLGLGWLLGMALVAAALRPLVARFVVAPASLLEETRVLLDAKATQQLTPRGSAELYALAEVINELAAQRERLRSDVAQQIEEAGHSLQQEKNRLAALMSELTQSVVVCNLDGRILLYNNQARQQLRALSPAPLLAGGAELIGIGRSIYGVLERPLVTHALERIHQQIARGLSSPSTHFVTTAATGQLLRVNMAAVSGDTADELGMPRNVSGFVLMFENVTEAFEQDSKQAQLLHGLTEGNRSSVANMQAAVDMLGYADTSPEMRERFLDVVRDELAAMRRRINDRALETSQGLKTRWPMEDMRGADLVSAAQNQIERQCGRSVAADGVDAELWLKVDSFALLQVLGYLAWRVVDEFDVRCLHLRLKRGGQRAHLDLVWTGAALSTETVMSWETEPMQVGARGTALTVRDVLQRHDGEMWFERGRVRHEAFFRILLPLADSRQPEPALQQTDARPEYYDFDLFRLSEQTSTLDDRPLSELTYTVFDTETTGLDPSAGDEIIQLGAARIVNGKLLHSELFDQLVNPGRKISAASIPIHGITDDMVAGRPRIAVVLPAFHAFALDSVLVAHNAAFDMKFLQLKEGPTGVAFRQPVLDTLLLSAVVHPNQPSHSLDAIAARLNIAVYGRHTAIGDAVVTAEVWLRLIPLLKKMGVCTLRQAREAAQNTYYARLKY